MIGFTYKDSPFVWSSAYSNAFQQLKKTFIIATILIKFDPDKQIVVKFEASNYLTGGDLFQFDSINTLWPVAYFSKKHTPAKYNYKIYDKELIAIIQCFEAWKPELEGPLFLFTY